MAEYTNLSQTVAPNSAVTFSDTPVPCNRGLIRHREGTGVFNLSGAVPNTNNVCPCGCGKKNRSANYLVEFSANIAVPTTGTAGEISLAFTLGPAAIPVSQMIVTPTATGAFFNVSRAMNIQVWSGCCQDFSVINTSTQEILVDDANLVITRPDLNVTM